MANPFANYQIIDAENFVRNNIKPDAIENDVNSLMTAISPLSMICKQQRGSSQNVSLHPNLIARLDAKWGTLKILELIGYRRNNNQEYKYDAVSDAEEIERREIVVRECRRLCEQLKKAKNGMLPDFEQFIKTNKSKSSISVAVFPCVADIKEGNERTVEAIRLFKEKLNTDYGNPPPSSFVRRKLALERFKQKYHDSIDSDFIDEELDSLVMQLKLHDQTVNVARDDEIYVESLIRTNFEFSVALRLLAEERPNFKPPSTPIVASELTITSISSAECVLSEVRIQQAEQNQAAHILLHAGDEWKNVAHVIPAISQLRTGSDPSVSAKIFRLLYSELSRMISHETLDKIEQLTSVLSEIDVEILKRIDVSDLRDISSFSTNGFTDSSLKSRFLGALSIECPMCLEAYPRSHIESFFLCQHHTCVHCMKIHYEVTIEDSADDNWLNKLTCYENHEIPTDIHARMNFFQLTESTLIKLFPDKRRLIDLYHEKLFQATRTSGIIKCGSSTCTASFYADNTENIVHVRCPHCGYQQCLRCRRLWYETHIEQNCEEYAAWLAENDPDDPDVQLAKYMKTAGLVCPNSECQAVFEYEAGGCEHFTCRQCRTEFCRICSSYFYNPEHGTRCPIQNCPLVNTLHAHCALNCYRQIRDCDLEKLIEILKENDIDVDAELEGKQIATDIKCPVSGCQQPASAARENRFCERCYIQFVCLLIWRNELEPWKLYDENQLRARLNNAGHQAPEEVTHDELIELAQQYLTQFLGKPKPLPRLAR